MRWRRSAAAIVSVVLGATALQACRLLPPVPPQTTGCPSLAVSGDEPAPTAGAPTARDATPDDEVHVATALSVGAPNRDLTGVVWNSGSSVSALAPVHPSIVRIDGSLQSRSLGPDELDLQPLLDRVAQVRDIGAEPLVILSYMPRWLGQPRATDGQDPTRMAPYDLDLWQDLVTTVVRTLATADKPAYRFETWNEPDLPIFWADTRDSFIATALRSHLAVAQVKAETGLPLEIGGPASFTGGSSLLPEYVKAVADAGLPLDFLTWHAYANFPFLGPDGPEGNLPDDLYQKLAKRNPNTTPLTYSAEIRKVRAETKTALGDSKLPPPELIIDEWNVSAGGYDVRNDDAEGASLVAGILIEMEKARLDEAALYRAVSGDHIGDWGLVYADGTPKPSWWVFRAWSMMSGDRLFTTGDDPASGVWARATRDGGCIDVLLTNFVATGAPERTVAVHLDGKLPPCAGERTTTLAKLDGTSTNLTDRTEVPLDHGAATVSMASQSVALLQVSCADQAET